MTAGNAPRFGDRRVQEWLELAEQGKIALPSFQRSYVWKSNQSIADYLHAVFENRPTGVFLVLKTNGRPQFRSRSLKGMEVEAGRANELLLDGQQRLTSLWAAFEGSAEVTYYVEVRSLAEFDVSVRDIRFWSDRSAEGREMKVQQNAYRANMVPVAILRDKPTSPGGLGQIWEWCNAALNDANDARMLERAINCLQKEVLFQRNLHYCELDADTEKDKAIDIFVQSNKSSVKVNEFDIAVALALGEGGEYLRDRISDFNLQSNVIRHYFNADEDDEEAVIAPLGERLLFSACIAVKGVAPKRSRFDDVIEDVFQSDGRNADRLLAGLLHNVEAGLTMLSEHGVATGDMLPALPSLHVLTALQDHFKELKSAAELGIANRLISAYLWRSFFTERYEAKANDRLFEDYEALKKCIGYIKEKGALGPFEEVPIFRDREYPLPGAEMLGNLENPKVPWIKGASRLGRAVAALSLCGAPIDWATKDKLNANKLRQLKSKGKLHRHHIFPRKVLGDAGMGRPLIYHGLNGVVLSKPTNSEFSKNVPADYLRGILKRQRGLREEALRKRVESHLVPYDVLFKEGDVGDIYRQFIARRAELLADKIAELAEWPGG